MMHDSLTRVLVERERLRTRIEVQRADTERYLKGLAVPMALIDRVRLAARFVRAHPAVLAAAMGSVFALRARSMLSLFARGVGLWRLGVRARQLLRRFGY